ncbi:hypothetical protein GCM10020218_002460 [Dactylosporangium vinaceum]|uniref:phosphoserine phosphatase n=1 Tax=Dactylosporangium vinaceum TaxID=53362 RepID=A0ABV5M3N1_9ACTN|nr:HAD-IB family phosphatase [Dactylosporangium vinaceum]
MALGLVFFDIDGTLAPTSSGLYLAELFGSAEVVQEVHAGYGAGTLSSREAAILEARGWATFAPAQVWGFLESLPLVDGVAETVQWCRRRGLVPVLATLAWEPVSRYLCDRFGFVRACGPRLELVDGRFTGEVAELFDESDKRDFGLALAAEMSVDVLHCAAVGDGRSDVPLFGVVGLAVAFNASAQARQAAHVSVEGGDLRAVLPALEEWLSIGMSVSGDLATRVTGGDELWSTARTNRSSSSAPANASTCRRPRAKSPGSGTRPG